MPKRILALLIVAALGGASSALKARDSGLDGVHFGRLNISGGMGHKNRSDVRKDNRYCRQDSDCGLYGCRYLWQTANACH